MELTTALSDGLASMAFIRAKALLMNELGRFRLGFPAQVAFLVEDIDKAAELYGSLFGIERWNHYYYDENFVPVREYMGQAGTYSMKLALGGENPQVELIQAVEGPSIYHDFLDAHGYGLHHIGVVVDDLNDELRSMLEAGYEPIQRGEGYGVDGDGAFAYFDTTNALGVIIELIELPMQRRPPLRIQQIDFEQRDNSKVESTVKHV
jgi:catechol 2,3-dioxygenase-like lactoylglutathione lyase family enzyme